LTRSDLEPYQHQLIEHLKGVQLGTNQYGAAAWVDMGLGKTVCSLTATQDLMESLDVHRTLVVAPKRVARKVWTDEMAKWDHLNMSIGFADKRGREAQEAIDADTEIMTIGRDNLAWLCSQYVRPKKSGSLEIVKEWPWDQIVLDESSSFKNRSSLRWRAIYRMKSGVRNLYDRMQQLTGSPAPNGLIDVWAPIYLMDCGERLGTSLTSYRHRWFEGPNYDHPYSWSALPSAQAQVEGYLKDIVISMEADDYLDLPPVMENWINVELTPSEWNIYNTLRKTYVTELSDGKVISAANAGVLQGKLLQLANGAVYDENRLVHHCHDAKLRALLEIIDQACGQPVMVFYSFQHDLTRIGAALDKNGIHWRKLDTEQDEDDWNAGRITVLLLHPAGAGHGLNLQDGGEIMVWFGLNWSLELYRQAIARLAGGLRRIGKNIINHHIVAPGTADDDARDGIAEKWAVERSLMRAMKALGLAIVR